MAVVALSDHAGGIVRSPAFRRRLGYTLEPPKGGTTNAAANKQLTTQ